MAPSFLPRLVAGFICCLSAFYLSDNSPAALGDLAKQYSFPASAFVMHPTQPHMYAVIPSQNSVAIINTKTLEVESTVFVGSGPTNLALSPDGLKAYIANSTSSFVVVLDTQTRTVIDSFLIPQAPYDVVFGSQNRLFVLSGNSIYQIDATTGASIGPAIGSGVVYSGALEISPDRNTLYYGQYGLSPTRMYKFDISGVTPTLLKQAETGSNGQDLTLSHDGSFICHPNGAPYLIAKYRTSDFATLGSFNTGAYPREAAFSPDDAVPYTVHTSGQIDVFDANTFLSAGNIVASGEANELGVDSSGRYLFAGYTDSFNGSTGTRVYDTHRVIALGAVSRKGHGSAGSFDTPLPLTGAVGIECRSGGATNDYTIVVGFAGDLPSSSPQAQVTLGSATIGSAGMSNGGNVTVAGSTITIPLTNVANAQTINVRLTGLPNGGTTSNMTIPMKVLIADTNADGVVNSGDAIQTRGRSGEDLDAIKFRSDVNADGVINSGDASVVRARSGQFIP